MGTGQGQARGADGVRTFAWPGPWMEAGRGLRCHAPCLFPRGLRNEARNECDGGDGMALARRARQRVGHGIEALAAGLAVLGGLVLCAMAVMTMVSITGRALVGFGLGPVRGDYELVANGCALAVFAFLPLCQLKRGHVTVDILIARFSARAQAVFGLIGDALVALAAIVITRQLWFAFGEKFPYGSDAFRTALGMGYKPFFAETTYELQIPVWIPYGAALVGAGMFVIVSLYCVWRAADWVVAGQEGTP